MPTENGRLLWLFLVVAAGCESRPASAPTSERPAQATEPVALTPNATCVSESPPPGYPEGLANVARNGTASQSSTGHWEWDAAAGLAIDGNRDGDYFAHSVAHTLDDAALAWWQVDLGHDYPIRDVVIWNRTDNDMGKRLTNFTVEVSRAEGSAAYSTRLCADGRSFSPAMTVRVPHDAWGRYVRIRLNRRDFLQLAEVEVLTPIVP